MYFSARMNVPSSWARKSGSGILTGRRNMLTSSPFLTVGVHSSRRESNQGSNSSLSKRTETEEDELMLYLSQTKQKSTEKVDWAAINDLEDIDALSDFDLEKPRRDEKYFLKQKILEESSVGNTRSSTDSFSKVVTDKTSACSNLGETSEDVSLSSSSQVLKGNNYMLDKLEEEISEASTSISQKDASTPVTHSNTTTSDDEIKSCKSKDNHLSRSHSSKSISTVSENLETSVAFTDEEEECTEKLYSSDFEDSLGTDNLLAESQSTVKDNQTGSDDSTITINVISNLPSSDNSRQLDNNSETSIQYTTDFTSVSESDSTRTESILAEQSTSHEPTQKAYNRTNANDAGTQTLLGGMDHSTHSTKPHCLLGFPRYSTDYQDPTPLVLHRDTLDVLTAYSPNILALNDMMKSQLTLTRKLLDANTALMQSLSSSLTPDYKYTTLEETKRYVEQHKPKTLSLQEVRKKKKENYKKKI